jgi:peroxiredoxin Q/BCP
MRIALILIIAVLVMVFGWKIANAGNVPQSGTEAPDFSLPSQDGSQISLKDFRGKWVVLYFYPKDFTSGCTVEAHNFQRDQAEYAKRNAVILGVSVDSADSHKKFCDKEGLNFKLLADTERKVSQLYGSAMNFAIAHIAARHTFLIGPDGRIERSYTSVNPGSHSREVLAALDQLQRSGGTQ